ncbi:hypothetical protein M426DRAFT_67703 [Hypoxylon sp. CI-4A]|nr:hypothetical protein M426DRAFT_67703 [Hypoxylon sp. CI-4A]
MDRFHTFESIRSAVRNALPSLTVESIKPLPSYKLLRFFSIVISDGRSLVLSLPPPLTFRLLRFERATIISEALITKWLLEQILGPNSQGRMLSQKDVDAEHTERQFKVESGTNPEGIRNPKAGILKFLPLLVTHSSSSKELGSPFNIFEPDKGVSVVELPIPLTITEKSTLDQQRGQLIRQLSSFTSPNGLFGPVLPIIGSQAPSTELQGLNLANFGFRGATTWRQAFHSLLEGVLRDAEDMAVTISYEPIRGYFNRLGFVLDGVTVARLVVLDACDEPNVLVSRSTKSTEKGEAINLQTLSTQEAEKSKIATNQPKKESSQEEESRESANTQPSTISLTGIRDWSNCIFGDPLFAEVFNQQPSAEFLRGFRGTDGRGESTDDGVVEDCENAPMRLLLYECYHATVGVVKQFYRPGPNSSDREIAARRRLATALRRLQEVDDETSGKRPRRPSANVVAWPVKRPKANERSSPGPSTG